MQQAPTLSLQNIALKYKEETLFSNLNLTFSAGKISCLLGRSGTGKSSLLRLIAGLIQPDNGTITCDNAQPLNQQVAFMQQEDLLMPWATALNNALIGARLRGKVTTEQINYAHELFRAVGLSDAVKKLPHQLSGGMRQRVALVRTLMEDKAVILMDEPFSAIDAITRFQLQNLATTLLQNRTVILVTHDPFEALRVADDIYILLKNPVKISLHSAAPRDLNDPEIIQKQTEIFHALTEGEGVIG